MHFSALVSCALITLLGISSASPVDTTSDFVSASDIEARLVHGHPSTPPLCVKGIHIVATSGIGSAHEHSYGLLISTVQSIQKAVPKTSSYALNYPKASTDFDQSTARGQVLLVSYLKWYTEGCPHVPIVLLGYSEGAMITMNSLCGRDAQDTVPARPLPLTYKKNVIATVVMGDETFVPLQSYNRGTCVAGQGVAARSNAAECAPWANEIRSYCDNGDDECCDGEGYYGDAHHTYTIKYDEQITKFVVGKYKTWLKNQ